MKRDLQRWLREIPWAIHLVVSEHELARCGDAAALESLRRTNYAMCKRFLPRRFARLPVQERFHWAAVFHGDKLSGTRHLHLLFYAPPKHKPMDEKEAHELQCALQEEWLASRLPGTPTAPWTRPVLSEADNKSVATYVSRFSAKAGWELGVIFSQ